MEISDMKKGRGLLHFGNWNTSPAGPELKLFGLLLLPCPILILSSSFWTIWLSYLDFRAVAAVARGLDPGILTGMESWNQSTRRDGQDSLTDFSGWICFLWLGALWTNRAKKAEPEWKEQKNPVKREVNSQEAATCFVFSACFACTEVSDVLENG